MPVREVPVCAKCGSDIEEDPLLGDRQGGLREIVHPGTTWRITLCTKCVTPLFELYEEFVELVKPGGTAVGAEVLKFLPRVIVDDEQDGAAIQPPRFSEER